MPWTVKCYWPANCGLPAHNNNEFPVAHFHVGDGKRAWCISKPDYRGGNFNTILILIKFDLLQDEGKLITLLGLRGTHTMYMGIYLWRPRSTPCARLFCCTQCGSAIGRSVFSRLLTLLICDRTQPAMPSTTNLFVTCGQPVHTIIIIIIMSSVAR